MACNRGEVSPDDHTKLRLFADSGGYCQKPACRSPLFREGMNRTVHVAEMAHIVAAADTGPRAKLSMPKAQRGVYENLILLCPTCHTEIDKLPDVYSESIVLQWKREHKQILEASLSVVKYGSRREARATVEAVLAENRRILLDAGPDNDYREDPESELATLWRFKLLSRVLPNNRKLLHLLDANVALLTISEREILEEFRQHVLDLEARHIGSGISRGARFPTRMNAVFMDIGGE